MKIQETKGEYVLRLVKKRVEEAHFEPKLKRVIDRFLAIGEISYQGVAGHAEHVAILSKRIARRIGQDENRALAAGILHDIGKLTVRAELFDGMDIDPVEFARVKRHAMAGYMELRDIDLELALTVGMHHAVYEGGYGIFERDIPETFSDDDRSRIVLMATIVSIADFIDADLTRLTTPMEGAARDKAGTILRLWQKYPARSDIILAAVAEAEGLYEVKLKD